MDPILPYAATLRVRFSDTDAQGHLYFANYLVYADEVAGFYMEELGFGAMNPQLAPCFIFTVNIQCDYLGECRAYEEVEVRVGYTRLGRTSAELAFLLQLDGGARPLARGSITQVFVDKQTREPTPIPRSFRAAILEHQPMLRPPD